jgi:OmpA family
LVSGETHEQICGQAFGDGDGFDGADRDTPTHLSPCRGRRQSRAAVSERRAEAVKRFLIENYHVPSANLITAGYGKTHLKNTADPFAAENRRAQIANVVEAEQASQ